MNKKCKNCIFQIWAVGVGQGVFCLNQENEGKNLGFGLNKREKPMLPATEDFVCEHWTQDTDA
jgi:hypothetical protein